MNFLKQIFESGADDSMHHKFIRFGKGEYERFLFSIKKGKKNFKVKSSSGFANDFIKIISENTREKMDIKGEIIAPRDFEKEIEGVVKVAKFSRRGKLYTAELNTEMVPEQLRQIYELFEKNYLLLNINSESFKLKTKSSLPKPGGKVKDDFCSATLPSELLDEFAWDVNGFETLEIKHILNITDIVVSAEFKNDPARARLEARRKGKITRVLKIDNKEEKRETDFEA